MLIQGPYEKAREYIVTHSKQDSGKSYQLYPCITLSRETGAGADIVSEELVKFFNRYEVPGSPAWTIFDKNLINKVLEEHHLPSRLEKFLEEDKYSIVTSLMTELLTGQPSTWTLIKKEIQTIHKLGRIGNVIIIGRGSNFITSRLKNTFHARLVAPWEQRVKHVEELYNLGRKEAETYIKKDDTARRNFVFAHFRQEVDNPVHYHLVINTGQVSHTEAANIIGRAIVKKFRYLFPEEALEEIYTK